VRVVVNGYQAPASRGKGILTLNALPDILAARTAGLCFKGKVGSSVGGLCSGFFKKSGSTSTMLNGYIVERSPRSFYVRVSHLCFR